MASRIWSLYVSPGCRTERSRKTEWPSPLRATSMPRAMSACSEACERKTFTVGDQPAPLQARRSRTAPAILVSPVGDLVPSVFQVAVAPDDELGLHDLGVGHEFDAVGDLVLALAHPQRVGQRRARVLVGH